MLCLEPGLTPWTTIRFCLSLAETEGDAEENHTPFSLFSDRNNFAVPLQAAVASDIENSGLDERR